MTQESKYKILGKDAYEVLGITEETLHDIGRQRYRKLLLKYHPDRFFGAEEKATAAAKLKEVVDAWDEIEDTLPKSEIPFPDIGSDDPEFEDKIAAYMLAQNAALPKTRAKPQEPRSSATPNKNEWHTVASETASGTDIVKADAKEPIDWRHQKIRCYKSGIGLDRIWPEEAANLIFGRPNAFAALKIVQQRHPELCLYDAILSRTQGASRKAPSGSKKSTSSNTALVIFGVDVVDKNACLNALQYPLISIKKAMEEIHLIAPHINLDRTTIPQQKLAFDLQFLESDINDLIKKMAGRPIERRDTGTDIATL